VASAAGGAAAVVVAAVGVCVEAPVVDAFVEEADVVVRVVDGVEEVL